MLFRRRQPAGFGERVRVWLWPRRSWSRSLRYVLARIVRLRSNAHTLALGCAAGVFVSCTPLIGGQIVLAALLAFSLRASVPAAMLATFFGNPLSWPLIWPATYLAGAHMLGGSASLGSDEVAQRIEMLRAALEGQSPELIATASAFVAPVLLAMLAGSLPIGLAAGVAIYYMMRTAARTAQSRRRLAGFEAAAG